MKADLRLDLLVHMKRKYIRAGVVSIGVHYQMPLRAQTEIELGVEDAWLIENGFADIRRVGRNDGAAAAL